MLLAVIPAKAGIQGLSSLSGYFVLVQNACGQLPLATPLPRWEGVKYSL